MLAAQLGSISAVSRKLGKDLGNLSKVLTKLEELHGEALFVRHQTGLELTIAGTHLLGALEKGREAFQAGLISKDQSVLRIGFSPSIGFGYFGHFIPFLGELRLSPLFTLAPSLELFELLKKRELDFILAPRSPKFPGIISQTMFSTRLVLCSKYGKMAPKLIRSEDLFDLEERLRGIDFEETVILNDYFVAAKLLTSSEEYMGILPECILSNFPELMILNHRFADEKISVITWKGSPGVKLLKKAKDFYK